LRGDDWLQGKESRAKSQTNDQRVLQIRFLNGSAAAPIVITNVQELAGKIATKSYMARIPNEKDQRRINKSRCQRCRPSSIDGSRR